MCFRLLIRESISNPIESFEYKYLRVWCEIFFVDLRGRLSQYQPMAGNKLRRSGDKYSCVAKINKITSKIHTFYRKQSTHSTMFSRFFHVIVLPKQTVMKNLVQFSWMGFEPVKYLQGTGRIPCHTLIQRYFIWRVHKGIKHRSIAVPSNHYCTHPSTCLNT